MKDLYNALFFARRCFQMFRVHQRSVERSGVSDYKVLCAGVPCIALVFATGREAWRVSDFATNYFAQRGAKLEYTTHEGPERI